MIIALDHIVVLAHDLPAATAGYERLLGMAPSWRSKGEGGDSAVFTLGNVSLEILAPAVNGGERVRAALDAQGEGLASLAFQVDDIARFHHRLGALGLEPEEISFGESRAEASGAVLSWKRTRAATARTYGVRQFFLELDRARPPSQAYGAASILGIEYAVISTPNADRAAALYGARLGLDMTFDRRGEDGATSFMHFRCGDATLEVARSAQAESDKFWGVTWRVRDIDAVHARLASEGFNISEVRKGRREGTRVVTVRDAPCGVPTLLIETTSG